MTKNHAGTICKELFCCTLYAMRWSLIATVFVLSVLSIWAVVFYSFGSAPFRIDTWCKDVPKTLPSSSLQRFESERTKLTKHQKLRPRQFLATLTRSSWSNSSCHLAGVDASCDVLATFLRMVSPTFGDEEPEEPEEPDEPDEPDEHHKRGKHWRPNETNLQHQPDAGNNSLNGTPFRVGVFGGSISLEGWVRILQSHLTALELPVIVESNAIGATGTRFWLLCPPQHQYDIIIGEWTLNEPNLENLQQWATLAAKISRFIIFLDLFALGLRKPDLIDGSFAYKHFALNYLMANKANASHGSQHSSGCFVAFRDAATMWWRWMPPFTTRLLFDRAPEHCHAAAETEAPRGQTKEEAAAEAKRQKTLKTCMQKFSSALKHGGQLYQELVALSVSWTVLKALSWIEPSSRSPESAKPNSLEHRAQCVGIYGLQYDHSLPTVLPQVGLDTLNFTMSGFQYGDITGMIRASQKMTMYATGPGAVLELSLPQCTTHVFVMYVEHTWGPDGSTFEIRVQNQSRVIHTNRFARSFAQLPKVRTLADSGPLVVTSSTGSTGSTGSKASTKLLITTLDVPKGNFVEIGRLVLWGC